VQGARQFEPTLWLKQAAFPVHKTPAGFDLSVSSVSQPTFDYLASLE
jgi:hypothetical protein